MYAVVNDRGRQYRVKKGDRIDVDLIEVADGSFHEFDKVLCIGGIESGALVGTPLVEGARVRARVVGLTKGPKVRVFKLRRRKSSRTRKGHRQKYTRMMVEEIVLP